MVSGSRALYDACVTLHCKICKIHSMEEILGSFHAPPIYSAVSTVAQILLRNYQFVKSLRDVYIQHPEVDLLAVLLDLRDQFTQVPDEMDLNPLIQICRLAIPGRITVIGCLKWILGALNQLDGANPFKDIFYCKNARCLPAIIEVQPEETVNSALKARFSQKLGNIVFLSGTLRQFPASLECGEVYNLFAVVTQLEQRYCLYLCDLYGWLEITDDAIVERDSYSKSNVCLVAYSCNDTYIDTHRPRRKTKPTRVQSEPVRKNPDAEIQSVAAVCPPVDVEEKKYSLESIFFEASTMKIEKTSASFGDMKQCLAEIDSVLANYEAAGLGTALKVSYRVDNERITKVKPKAFVKEIVMYIEITKTRPLVHEFVNCQFTELQFTCLNSPQIAMNATFGIKQTAESVISFCKRLVEDVLRLDASRVAVFCWDGESAIKLYALTTPTVEEIKNSGSEIMFSIDGSSCDLPVTSVRRY